MVQRADPADGPEVLALYERVLREDRYFVSTLDELDDTPDGMAGRIRRLNAADNSLFLIAKLNKSLAGALKLQGGALRRCRHTAALEIFVDPALRGAGVGRALMDAAIQWAEETPALSRVCLTVFDDNARAIRLYRAMGFVEEGRRVGHYKERDGTLRGDVLMARPV